MLCSCQVYRKVSELYIDTYPSFLDYFMLDFKAIALSRCVVWLPGDSDTLCLTIPAWEVG